MLFIFPLAMIFGSEVPSRESFSRNKGIKKEKFDKLLKWIEKIYRPIMAERYGKSLTIEGKWEEKEVNAHATRDLEDNAIISIPGGLARHPLLTEDGLILVICHEMGHFLGGFPKTPRGVNKLPTWSSAEGQADYFASSKCFKTLLLKELLEKGVLKGNETDLNRELEVGIFENKLEESPIGLFSEQDIKEVNSLCSYSACKRFAYAALSTSRVFAKVKWDFETPSLSHQDLRKVEETLFQHTNSQCRLDTFKAGWFCPNSLEVPFDDSDPEKGACSSLGDSMELPFQRPSCWYAAEG